VLKSISRFSTGRRSKWIVVGFWLLLGAALASFQPKLQESTVNENTAFLPKSAESTEVNDLIESRFGDGREASAILAYQRSGGLTAADRARIAADAEAVCESELIGLLGVIDPFEGPVCGDPPDGRDSEAAMTPGGAGAAGAEGGPGGTAGGPGSAPGDDPTDRAVAEDGSVALTLVRTNAETSDDFIDNVEILREITPPAEAGEGELRSYVTGVVGVVADSVETFETIDLTLLTVTVTLVLVLLLAIYRSPTIAFVPLFVVGTAYMIAAAATYGLVKAGVVEVNGQTTAILIVLMFGAGTDYALLIVARFRDELRRTPDKHDAMARATERTAPAILSAGGTVIAAMLVLMLADLKSTATMGPVLAVGVAIMLAAGLTLLPALLSILGRRAFWPARPEYGSEQRRPLDVWRRIGHFVHERPVFVLTATVLVLAAGALGNLTERGSLDFGEGFRTDPDSVVGQQVIEEQLSGGTTAVTNVLVASNSSPAVATALDRLEDVASVDFARSSDDRRLDLWQVTLEDDPYSDRATDLVPEMRRVAREAAGDRQVLVGGASAEAHDTTETIRSDAKLIVPLILLVIFLILVALLRALVTPLYLVATVVLSYAFAVGASALIFTQIFNQPDTDPGLPTFAFIFLVALGVDYNIFLISRIREEAAYQETKDAVITGLERTGGVITSAGLILAGTFSALMSLPLEALLQLGFVIAFGLLVDTFIVRVLLVPAIAFKLGERNWWPSRLSHDAARPEQPAAGGAPPG
jgi:putative drug exporter of the RND superfamily